MNQNFRDKEIYVNISTLQTARDRSLHLLVMTSEAWNITTYMNL